MQIELIFLAVDPPGQNISLILFNKNSVGLFITTHLSFK